MKKLMIGLFSLVLALSLVSPVCAEDDFTPSISGGKAPGIVTETIDGEEVVGHVVNADNDVLATVFVGCLGVVTLEDAQDKESNISDSARKTLLDLYEDLLEKEIKLSEELPELNKLVEEVNRELEEEGYETDEEIYNTPVLAPIEETTYEEIECNGYAK